jgi:hypothetical protein
MLTRARTMGIAEKQAKAINGATIEEINKIKAATRKVARYKLQLSTSSTSLCQQLLQSKQKC